MSVALQVLHMSKCPSKPCNCRLLRILMLLSYSRLKLKLQIFPKRFSVSVALQVFHLSKCPSKLCISRLLRILMLFSYSRLKNKVQTFPRRLYNSMRHYDMTGYFQQKIIQQRLNLIFSKNKFLTFSGGGQPPP